MLNLIIKGDWLHVCCEFDLSAKDLSVSVSRFENSMLSAHFLRQLSSVSNGKMRVFGKLDEWNNHVVKCDASLPRLFNELRVMYFISLSATTASAAYWNVRCAPVLISIT